MLRSVIETAGALALLAIVSSAWMGVCELFGIQDPVMMEVALIVAGLVGIFLMAMKMPGAPTSREPLPASPENQGDGKG